MKIERFVLGSMGTNCYFIENEETNELVIIDPAVCSDHLVSYVKSNGYIPRAILLTHGHFDHVMGIDRWVEEFDVPVYLHKEEQEIIVNSHLNLSQVYGTEYTYENVLCLEDEEALLLAGILFQVIHTPGHTKGSCCYYIQDASLLISGDTLFFRSVGRSDFPTGDMELLSNTIREKLFCLPDDTVVYPGHESRTYIGEEKRHNPFV